MSEEEIQSEVNLAMLPMFTKKLWPYIRVYKSQFILGIALVFITTGLTIYLPWLLGHIVDQAFITRFNTDFYYFSALYLAITCLRALVFFLQNYSLTKLGQNVLHDLRQDLLKQYQFYPIAEFNRIPVGRMVTRLVNDTASLQDLFTSGVAVAFADALIILGIIIWMIFMNPKIGLICISVFPFMIWGVDYFGTKLRNNFRAARAALSKLNAFIAENINANWLIQIFNRQKDFKRKFTRINAKYTERSLYTVDVFALFQPLITILSALSMTLLIWVGGYAAIRQQISLNTADKISIGLLVAFMSYIQALFTPIRDITEKFNLFVAAMASCEKIFEFMDRPIESGIKIATQIHSENNFKGKLEFKNIDFEYTKDQKILKNINLKIEAGEKIGIVGHTGAGKTTLSALLMRFYDPTNGEILFDDKNILDFDKRTIRDKIGYIQQDPFLFSGSIADNIFLWDEKRKEVFDSLPLKVREPFLDGRLNLEQAVYEKGTNLSIGERQMVAFLRAIVKDPSILILDEATAHIDLLTEQWIEQVSDLVFKDKTVLIIAHRLSTLKRVNRILVFHRGELQEQGSHLDLISKNGIYQKLYHIQIKREQLLMQ